jgi:hypothetical protein
MMHKALIGMVILLLISVCAPQAQAQAPLPADLVMTASELNDKGEEIVSLVRWDAQEEKFYPFYEQTSPENFLTPLRWSPDGTLLAVERWAVSENQEQELNICILTREGVLVACSMNLVDGRLAESQERADFIERVIWSADSRYVYFTYISPESPDTVVYALRADGGTAGRNNTNTNIGANMQEVYRYANLPAMWPVNLSWTSDLKHLLVGVNNADRTEDLGAALINVDSGQTIDLKNLFTTTSDTLSYVCAGFSFDNQYATARITNDQTGEEGLAVFNLTGTIVVTLKVPRTDDDLGSIYCPTWQPGRLAFYWWGSDGQDPLAIIFEYDLETGQSDVVYGAPPSAAPDSMKGVVIRISDVYRGDPTYIAADGSDGSIDTQAVVILPDGTRQVLLGDYVYTQNALWFPPLSGPSATPTAGGSE